MREWQFRILTTTGGDGSDWHRAFDNLDENNKDLHFLPEYTLIYERTYGQKGFLAFFGDRDDFIITPFIVRPIRTLPFVQNLPEFESLCDIVNPYGYGGPLAKITHTDIAARLYNEFFNIFSQYCMNNGILCEFAILHPLLANHQPLIDFGIIEPVRRKPIVYFDLYRNEHELWKGLSRGNQSSINKARQKGVTVVHSDVSGEALTEFRKLYDETMKRHNADQRWLFPDNYFSNCAECLGHDRVSLFRAQLNDVTISSYLILHAFGTAYYHFGGSLDAYFDLRANNLLMYEIALWAKSRGFRWFHLGGGLQKDDSLYRFKSGFSKDIAWLYTYSRIFNNERYSYLCSMKNRWDQERGAGPSDEDFFPVYRR